ncbi:MAG: protein-glutamate O-methyltransferase CheR, partial [Niallia sp.]
MNNPFLNNDPEVENPDHADIEVNLLLEGIFRLSGFDFRQYNRSSITRRIYYRMKMDNIPTIT